MLPFIQKHAGAVIGILSGFDRLVLRGTLRSLCYPEGMMRYLNSAHILLKDFSRHVQEVTEQIRVGAVKYAQSQARPVQYLPSAQIRKETVAHQMAQRDHVQEGLICLLTSVEPCRSFEIYRNRATKRLELVSRLRKCLHLYFYFLDQAFGFMHVRLQSWFPFSMQVCLNGREWLARQMDAAGIAYRRRENCFVWIEDVKQAQILCDRQLRVSWPMRLLELRRTVHPLHEVLFPYGTNYYWTVYQSEYATDVLFGDAGKLASLYPVLIHHAMTTFGSQDVMRFLGRRVSATSGRVHGRFEGEVVSDMKHRPEGVRIKHRINGNSIKLYDKQASVLRVETTINDPSDFKVFRPKEGDPLQQKDWRGLRKGIADLHRRADVSKAANERYLQALTNVHQTTRFGSLIEGLSHAVVWNENRFRGLNVWGEDALVLTVIGRGEFAVNGFRNRDLRGHLYDHRDESTIEQRRRSGQITRKLRMLRAHGLIKKVPKTHRYMLTEKGRSVVVAIGAARNATVSELTALAV